MRKRPWAWLGGGCPEEEVLATYVEGKIFGRAKRRLQTHLAGCAACRDNVAFLVRAARNPESTTLPGDYLAAAAAIRSRAPAHLQRWAAVGTASLVLLLGGFLLLTWTKRSLDVQRAATTPIGPTTLPTAKAEPRTEVSSQPRHPILRGTGHRNSVLITSPAQGTTIPSGRLRFTWRPASGAIYYELRVTTAAGEVKWDTRVEATEVSLPNDIELSAGSKNYVWVRAHLQDGSTEESPVVTFFIAR